MFVIGPEDFVVNKLAMGARGVQDEQDAISVPELQKRNLHYAYVRKGAKQAGVTELLETLMPADNPTSLIGFGVERSSHN